MRDDGLAAVDMAEIGASSDPLPRRGEQALTVLRRVVPFDSAWLALVDPRLPDYTTLADADLATSTLGITTESHPGDPHGLMPRELEVLRLIVEGCSNGQIARTLVVSQRTVAAHVGHIPSKLHAPTRTPAAVRAERAGLYVPAREEEGRSR